MPDCRLLEPALAGPTWGFLLGADIERQLDRHGTARLEYRFTGFRKELALPAVDGPGWNYDLDIHRLELPVLAG